MSGIGDRGAGVGNTLKVLACFVFASCSLASSPPNKVVPVKGACRRASFWSLSIGGMVFFILSKAIRWGMSILLCASVQEKLQQATYQIQVVQRSLSPVGDARIIINVFRIVRC